MIRDFSQSRRKRHSDFHRLLELECETEEYMTNSIREETERDNLKLTDLGIRIDGANAITDEHNSVSSRLTYIIPHLVSIKCLSNSLHLSAVNSCELLPEILDFLDKQSQS